MKDVKKFIKSCHESGLRCCRFVDKDWDSGLYVAFEEIFDSQGQKRTVFKTFDTYGNILQQTENLDEVANLFRQIKSSLASLGTLKGARK